MSDDHTSTQPSDPSGSSGRPVWLQMLLGLVMAIVGLLAVGLLVAYMLPSSFVVSRSILINAPPEDIHPYINTLSQWPEWTAWNSETYPELKYTFEGSESGIGAVQSWTDPGMGGGRLEITDSSEQKGVEFILYFDQSPEPLIGSLTYAPADSGDTLVTWTSHGDLGTNPISRYFGLMMDSMIGADYEAGLRKLKILVEAPPAE